MHINSVGQKGMEHLNQEIWIRQIILSSNPPIHIIPENLYHFDHLRTQKIIVLLY